MSILETSGNSCICEVKGLTPQAPAPNFSSLMGCVLQTGAKIKPFFSSWFSQYFITKTIKTTTTKNNKAFQANTRQSQTAQAAVVVSISA